MTTARGDQDRTSVLWVSKGLGPGGAERLLLSFARTGDHERFAFAAAYLLPQKDHLVGRMTEAQVEVTCLDARRMADPSWLMRLRRLLSTRHFDVVHFHSPLVAAMARPIVSTMRRPRPALVTTAHNVWPSFHLATRVLDRLTASMDDHVFAVSAAVHDSLPSSIRDRSEVLVHGVDVDGIADRRSDREEIRRRLGLTDERIVVTVANLRTDKDYPNLFDAASLVCAEHPDVVFVSVGQGPLEDELRADLRRRGLTDRFRMLGYQEDPVAVLVAADVFTLASRQEGLPIALLEALAAGLPAAVTAVGGVPGVITDGVEGRLVPPRDPESLAAAIGGLLDPDVHQRTGAAASIRARDFDIRRAVARQQAVYAALTGAHA